MSDRFKTAAMVAVAVICATLAWWSAPRSVTADAVQDRGQPFFPDFTDTNEARSLEVFEFDEAASAVRPLKVLNRDGRWTIPSHYNYLADGSERLSSIAAAVIAMKKEDVASDSLVDHERCGVLDPLDETLPAAKGRGTRITVQGPNDRVLADVIVGHPVEGRPALRYVRLPSQRRVYVASVGNLQVSTAFQDWIERDLLLIERNDIDQILIRHASIEPQTLNIRMDDVIALRRTPGSEQSSDRPDAWTMAGVQPGERIDPFRVNLLITKLDELTIDDVRPKPPGITQLLSEPKAGQRLAESELADLESKGFYVSNTGLMLSSEGDVVVHTTSGMFYTLRFGKIVSDSGGQGRYLFASAGYDPNAGGSPDGGSAQRLAFLRLRFAPWYYVVSEDTYNKVHLRRSDLLSGRGSPSRSR